MRALQEALVVQVKLELEALVLARPELHAFIYGRIAEALERAGRAAGLPHGDPWLRTVVRAWEARARL